MSVTTSCLRCHTPLEAGAKYCQVCGMNVSGEQTAPLPTLLQILRQATLGEYEIIREIGQGGMATVYLAHEITLDRKVAIKVMSPTLVQGADMIQRFKREARTAASLNHPHIVPIYAVRESEHLLFFVMKYLKGRALDAILKDVGPLPFPMVRTILTDVGSALDYAHRQGVVHRDVKPGNIMIDEEGFASITDFGIAKATEGASLTRSGTTVGTPSYLSPEACSGDVVGPAADQYSLGIVGYEMITGQLPFTAESSLGMMYAQVHTPPRPSDQLRPDCPPDLHDAITRMLEKSPYDRYPSMKEAVQALSGGRASGSYPAGDDHVRSHVGLLAVPRPNRAGEAARRTPASPVALASMAGAMPRPRRRARISVLRVATGLALAAIGAALALFAVRQGQLFAPPPAPPVDSSPPPPSTADVAADSTWLEARGAAQMARQQALGAGAREAALRAGDSLRSVAESLAATGRKAEAATLLYQAGALWSAAKPPPSVKPEPERPDRSRTAHRSPGPTRPAATESIAIETPPSDSAVIAAFYLELAHAIQSRQLGEVKRLLPNLSESDERNWRSLFEDDRIRSLDAQFQVHGVSRDGQTAYARVLSKVVATKVDGKLETKRQALEYTTLTYGPQGWRQIRAERAP
jgi:tRNA A-37 threonylcarbamoyl transferase component Bud32